MDDRLPFLVANGLSVGYVSGKKEKRLFSGLDLSLFGGELVCFMGPNGIGKSSLLRTLAGLQKPLAGTIGISGRSGSTGRARDIAVVLTGKVSANLTVEELITLGRYPYLNWNVVLRAEDRKIMDRAVRLVQIQHLLREKIHSLSDGQLQMVMIARALAQDTPILLLDEPTAHLDLNNRVEIMKLLRTLAGDLNKAVLIATHELDLALQMADHIWLTGRDQNILKGIPEDLVLNGAFDSIFQFKGFDLKTGKVQHTISKPVPIQLTGDGHEYLWTRNALERYGYEVINTESPYSITIFRAPGSVSWHIRSPRQSAECTTLEALIKMI